METLGDIFYLQQEDLANIIGGGPDITQYYLSTASVLVALGLNPAQVQAIGISMATGVYQALDGQ